MQADENGVALRVDNRGAIIEGRIDVAAARHHHLKALRTQGVAHNLREFEHEVFFRRAGGPARARVRASVRWIKNDYAQSVYRLNWSWRCLRRWRWLSGLRRRRLRRRRNGLLSERRRVLRLRLARILCRK